MPMTLISLLAFVISSRCTMSSAISPPGRPRRTSTRTLPKHEKWWLYERPGPPCRLHHRSREEPAGRSSTMNILGITIDERLSVSDHVDTILLIKLPANSQSERDAKENPSPGNSHDDDRSVDVWLTNLVGLFEQTGP